MGKGYQKGAQKGGGSPSLLGAIFEKMWRSGPSKRTFNSRATPETASKRHLGAQGAQEVSKWEHFGALFGTFSESGVKSENGVLA